MDPDKAWKDLVDALRWLAAARELVPCPLPGPRHPEGAVLVCGLPCPVCAEKPDKREIAVERLTDLAQWLRRGGFPPKV